MKNAQDYQMWTKWLAVSAVAICVAGCGSDSQSSSASAPESVLVTSTGGAELTMVDGTLVVVPPDTVAEDTTLTVSWIDPSGLPELPGQAGQALVLEPKELALGSSITISYAVPENAVLTDEEPKVRLLMLSEGNGEDDAAGWYPPEIGSAKIEDGVVKMSVSTLGTFTVTINPPIPEKKGIVVVEVFGADNVPRQGITVQLWFNSETMVDSRETASNGETRFVNLENGEYSAVLLVPEGDCIFDTPEKQVTTTPGEAVTLTFGVFAAPCGAG